MKHEILDAPFEEELIPRSLETLLEENEDILWTGSPKQNYPFTGYAVLGMLLLCSYFIFYNPLFLFFGIWAMIIPVALIVIGHILLTGYKNKRKAKTIYHITPKRILFQFFNPIKKEIHEIPFSEIRDVIIIQHSLYNRFRKHYGVIYLVVKNPSAIPFDTYNFEVRERRHQPTLELIEHPEAVANLIRKGIQGKL